VIYSFIAYFFSFSTLPFPHLLPLPFTLFRFFSFYFIVKNWSLLLNLLQLWFFSLITLTIWGIGKLFLLNNECRRDSEQLKKDTNLHIKVKEDS